MDKATRHGRKREHSVTTCSMEDLILHDEEEHFSLRFIDTYIGHGVFAKKQFKKADFLLEYKGKLTEGLSKGNASTKDNGFTFYFRHNGKMMLIDASESTGFGRMVNDNSKANCKMKKYTTSQDVPKLGLVALKNIAVGEELRYDYGVKDLPWRKLKMVVRGRRRL